MSLVYAPRVVADGTNLNEALNEVLRQSRLRILLRSEILQHVRELFPEVQRFLQRTQSQRIARQFQYSCIRSIASCPFPLASLRYPIASLGPAFSYPLVQELT